MAICGEINISKNQLLFLFVLLRYFYSIYSCSPRPSLKWSEVRRTSLLPILNWLLISYMKYSLIFKTTIYRSLPRSIKSIIGRFIVRASNWLSQWLLKKDSSRIMSLFLDWIGTNIPRKCIKQSLWLNKERFFKSWLIVYMQISSKCMKNCEENIFDLLFLSANNFR